MTVVLSFYSVSCAKETHYSLVNWRTHPTNELPVSTYDLIWEKAALSGCSWGVKNTWALTS